MKLITRLCVAASLAGILAGCATKQEVTPKFDFSGEAASLLSSGISAPATGTEVQFTFTSAASWTAMAEEGTKAHASWIVINPAAGKGGSDPVTVTITLHENGALDARSGVITFASGELSKTLQVSQAGRERQGITELLLSESSLELTVGDEYTLVATVLPSNTDDDKTVSWSSSAPAVASVSGGVVSAKAAGSAVITAKVGAKTASCTVTVAEAVIPVEPVEVESVTLNETSLTLKEGETFTLVATVLPENADDKTVLWSSSDPTVASVAGGLVTALKAGSVVITAKAGAFSATCDVTVEAEGPGPEEPVAVESVTLNKTELELEEGATFTLVATVLPADATNPSVTWTSSDPTVATVENGVVKALKAGTAVITAQAGEKTATCTVTVKAAEQPEDPDAGSTGEDLDGETDEDPWK